MQTGMEDMKLFTDYMIIYAQNLKESTTKKLELISHYSKVAGYKSTAFLYTKKGQSGI